MKRILIIAFAIIMTIGSMATFAACGDNTEYTIKYTIDGVEVTDGTPVTYKKTYSDIDLWEPTTTSAQTFDGWYVDENFEGVKVDKIPSAATGNREYYGRYILSSYSITYNVASNGLGIEGSQGEYSLSNEAYTLWKPTAPEGFIFNGWFENQTYTGTRVSQIPVNTTGDKVYYGRVLDVSTLERYSIKYTIEGEEVELGEGIADYYYESDSAEQLYTPDHDPQAVSFDGWYTKPDFTGAKVSQIAANDSGDKEYYGRFREPIGYGKDKRKSLDFTVERTDKTMVTLSDFYGVKPVVINLWFIACPHCIYELPDFEKVYKDKGQEIEFMIINIKDAKPSVNSNITSNGYTPAIHYYDTKSTVSLLYNKSAFPVSIFVDKWGYITTDYAGRISETNLRAEIQKAIDAAI